MNNTPTPRTDERKASFALDTIRQLETELAAAREELADWHNAAQQVKAEYPDEVHCSCVAILRKQLKDVTEQRDRLAEALKDALYDLETSDGLMACDNEEGHSLFCLEQRSIPKARQAIQSLNQAAVKGGSDE